MRLFRITRVAGVTRFEVKLFELDAWRMVAPCDDILALMTGIEQLKNRERRKRASRERRDQHTRSDIADIVRWYGEGREIGDALRALEQRFSLRDEEPRQVTPEELAEAWAHVASLHRAWLEQQPVVRIGLDRVLLACEEFARVLATQGLNELPSVLAILGETASHSAAALQCDSDNKVWTGE